MKRRSCLPNDPKIFVCICFVAFWICNKVLSYGRLTINFRIIALTYTTWLRSYGKFCMTNRLLRERPDALLPVGVVSSLVFMVEWLGLIKFDLCIEKKVKTLSNRCSFGNYGVRTSETALSTQF